MTVVHMTESARAYMHARELVDSLDLILSFEDCFHKGRPGGPTFEQKIAARSQIDAYLADHEDANPAIRHNARLRNYLGEPPRPERPEDPGPARYGLLEEIGREWLDGSSVPDYPDAA